MLFAEPPLNFTPWSKWKYRRSGAARGHGGVYVFGYFVDGPPSENPSADGLPMNVVYVGDAKDLHRRPLGPRHHRIKRYKQLFGDDGLDRLHIAVAPLYETGCADYHVMRRFSFYAEAMLTWRYTQRFGHPPVLHHKRKANEPSPTYIVSAVERIKHGE